MPSATMSQAGSLDSLIAEAGKKLASAGRKGDLHSLPAIYLLGDTGAARTTSVIRTGWNAELLAGEVTREGEVCPTATLNLWYADGIVLAEPGSSVMQDQDQMRRLFTRTRPGSVRTSFRGEAPWRAAVVVLSCERLLGPNAGADLQAIAARTGEHLRELSRSLGLPVPVYVLFTKMDRVPWFSAWARNLSEAEIQSLLGGAPQKMSVPGSTWGETASAAVLANYDAVIAELEGTRLDLLARESDAPRAAECYEFPREMRKLRSLVASFLVELVRPSQLHASPWLRGYYFTGVRAHTVEQAAAEPAVAAPSRDSMDVNATQVFRSISASPAAPPVTPRRLSQKVPQWVFLPRFFSHAVIKDAQSLTGRGATTRSASLLRRIAFGAAACVALICLAGFAVSYLHNRGLEQQARSAVHNLERMQTETAPGALATVAELSELDHLRALLVQMETWQQKGAPLSYRWGLYSGGALLAPSKQAYFDHFRQLLLQPAQNNILQQLGTLPPTPAANADYNSTYSALRAYLITTSNPDKSTASFLAPVLTQHWANGAAGVTPEQQRLAQQQFAYYAAGLPRSNPFPAAPVGSAVERARSYLAAFGGFERIYQSILTAAEKQAPAVDFNAQHPHSAEWVVEPHIVPGAFTPAGYVFVQNALTHPDIYFSGETWVLGSAAPPTVNPAALVQQVKSQYTTDYLSTWRQFVHDAQVVRGRNLAEAGTKLAALSGNDSPLLALIYTASSNTAVPDPAISAAFQPVQALVPPGSKDQYVLPSNKSYVDALLALRSSIQLATTNPAGLNDPSAAAPVQAAASAADLAAQQTAQSFHIDPQGHIEAATLQLMEAPIASVEALIRNIGPAAANAGGKSFCGSVNALFSKVPFNPSSAVQASPAEVAALLQPGSGQLWQFYNTNLKSALIQQGNEFAVAPNPPMKINPAFVRFLNRMAGLSAALFPAGGSDPTLNFTLKNEPAKGVQSATFKVDGQTLSMSDPAKPFTWRASTASSASFTANGLPLTFNGTWALFQLLDKARSQHGSTPGVYELTFPLEVSNTPVRAPDGSPIVVDYELSGPGASVLAPGALSDLHCVSTVAY